MVGSSGGEPGVRGFIAALDARTGQEVWRTYTIPGPGEPGHDTWTGQEQGANCWGGFCLDPVRGLAFFGTGSPKPNFENRRQRGTKILTQPSAESTGK